MKLTQLEKLEKDKTSLMFFIEGRNAKDIDIFSFVFVSGKNLEKFIESSKNNNFDPSKLGVVI